jgi:hypothetical protein
MQGNVALVCMYDFGTHCTHAHLLAAEWPLAESAGVAAAAAAAADAVAAATLVKARADLKHELSIPWPSRSQNHYHSFLSRVGRHY